MIVWTKDERFTSLLHYEAIIIRFERKQFEVNINITMMADGVITSFAKYVPQQNMLCISEN